MNRRPLALNLNPKFVFFSPLLHPADHSILAEHVDHAIIALDGRAPIGGDCCLEMLEPPPSGGTLRVELWVNDLGDFTCTYGFLVSNEDGHIPYARGERTVVNVDPASLTPSKWSPAFVHRHEELLKDLPAYA
ncbi:MAG TPA: hypothetical protein VF701_12485 [Thermoanaerobaculia bacterium]